MICLSCLWLLLFVFFSLPARAGEPPPRVAFSEVLYPLFQHDRCLNCHQFNSQRSQGRAYTTHRNRYLCETCHQPRLTGLPGGGWLAPNARLDYTGLPPRQTCELIKRNTGWGDKNALLRHHLLHDIRIHWAVASGVTPAGATPTLPGGLAFWNQAVEDWVASGMPCD